MASTQETSINDSSNGQRTGSSESDTGAIKDAAMEAVSSVNTLYEVGQDFMEYQTKKRPYAVLGVAAGIGFVLGGGLGSRLGGILLSIGTRLMATQVLETSLSDRDLDR